MIKRLIDWLKKFGGIFPFDDPLACLDEPEAKITLSVPGLNLNPDGSYWSHPVDTKVNGASFPHCDPRILHTPGNCTICDGFVCSQEARIAMKVAFTDTPPRVVLAQKLMPCPAITARGPDSVNHWPGNRANLK